MAPLRRFPLGATAGLLAILGAVWLLTAAPALAAESAPWWGLTAGSRPTNLQSGVVTNSVQDVAISATKGSLAFVNFPLLEASGFTEGFAVLPYDATAGQVQQALRASVYPERQVLVGGGPGDEEGSTPYEIEFPGQAVEPILASGEFAPLFGPPGTEALSCEGASGPDCTATAEVTVVSQGSGPDGQLSLIAENRGDANTSGAVAIADQLPAGLEAVTIEGTALEPGSKIRGPVSCDLQTLSCHFAEACAEAELQEVKCLLPPYEQIEVRIAVVVKPGAASGELNRATVSGGGTARAVAASHPITVRQTDRFGVEDFQFIPENAGGTTATQAGSHPFQQTTVITLNSQQPDPEGRARPVELPKDVVAETPVGFLGNPTPFQQCTDAQFGKYLPAPGGTVINECPAASAVGVATLTFVLPTNTTTKIESSTVPIFNMTPRYGEPARFGFKAEGVVAAYLDPSVRSAGDYGLTISSTNITQASSLLGVQLTLWGVPGDSAHDASRGWECIRGFGSCPSSSGPTPPSFLLMPTACGPFQATIGGDSWAAFGHPAQEADPLTYVLPEAVDGCNRLGFEPLLSAEPTSDAATSPTGLNFDLNFDDEGLHSPGGTAQSQMKKAVVTLPQGFTTNPSVAEGLHACSLHEYEAASIEAGTGCTPESKVGEVEIESPLVKSSQILKGGLYVAKQGENTSKDAQHPNGNLLTLYLIAREPEIGVIIKQALKVTADPVTGQLTTEVDNAPQLPFSRFHLAFRSGQRSPLITPPACGTYTVDADLYPWSNPSAPVHRESSFQITQGPEGLGCPSGGVPPFHPNLLAGSENPTAGAYSPFYTDITRKDSEQEITRFSIKLPTGMIAKLKGVSECSDAQVALAKSREVEGGGAVEQANPACPQNSEIGHTQVGTGVGNVLAYAPGKLYLAGPYHGSPISLVSVTAAKVGPFDLGTVVVRFALDVNHETAEVSVDGANSDPIPHIVDGIPVHLRDIQAFVDRPGFTLNPTSCAKKSTASTILGSGLNFASSGDDVPVTVSSPFQVGSCASLGFKPKLALNLVGKKTHRGALPAFKAVLTYPKGGAYANIAKAQVTLPTSEFLEQGHLKDVCTRKVFETGANPGENCPAKSIYGHAKAVTPLLDAPLEGPVYLRTGYGTKLPELAAALNGPQISITLAGKIDSVHKKGSEGSQIRNTFSVVPDAPVEKFVLKLKGGKKGLLVNSTDVCKGTHKALAAFTGQNGKLDESEPALKAQCGKGKAGAKKKGKGGE